MKLNIYLNGIKHLLKLYKIIYIEFDKIIAEIA